MSLLRCTDGPRRKPLYYDHGHDHEPEVPVLRADGFPLYYEHSDEYGFERKRYIDHDFGSATEQQQRQQTVEEQQPVQPPVQEQQSVQQ